MPRSDELAELLAQLKHTSGRSYEWIGKQVHAGKSTVQRYCTGQSVPAEFGTVERIARACGAGNEDIRKLFKVWARTVSAAEPAAVQEDQPPTPLPAQTPAVQVIPPVPRDRRFVWAAVAAVAALLAFTVSGDVQPQPPQQVEGVSSQAVSGPAWRRAPTPVPGTAFGVTINSWSGAMPSFRVGAVRFWDSRTQWANIEPRRGEFDWSVLDRMVAGAASADLPVLFVFGGTPAWANPTGPLTPYPEGSRAAAPLDLADWDRFVSAVVSRYSGRIEGYELWPVANDHRMFNGSVSTLAEMTRRASSIIRSTDPKAVVACPGMGNLWTPEGQAVLKQFAEVGGYAHCDVASIKMFQRSAADPPETMLHLATTVDRLLHESGVHPRLWNTGTTYSIPLQGSLPQTQARNYAVRFFLVGLYARHLNIERMYFYNWGGTKIPVVLQADGGAPTAAALAVEQLQRWLAHAQIQSCGQGQAIGRPANVWQCDFVEPGRQREIRIYWTDSATATITAEPRATTIHQLDGTTTPIRPRDTITITEEPILVEHVSRNI